MQHNFKVIFVGKLTLPRSAITEALGGDEVIRGGGTEGSPHAKMSKQQYCH